MSFIEIDIKTLAIQSVDEAIQSAQDRGIDLEGAEIVLSFGKTNAGDGCVRTRLINNVFVLSIEQASSSGQTDTVQESQAADVAVPGFAVPQWDGRKLRYCGQVIKRYRNPGPNQQTVLSAFEEEGWPERIDNPLCSTATIDAQSRLADTIKSLNRNHKCFAIRFHGDGSGQGIVWRPVSEDSDSDE